ncbi:MAG: mechanosensitive ion channel family protein [Gracilibacteraceae bacterium]|jgi:small-conductance mechanosensitive channel|nr:mechanosensitive ion channel family protein [Gracilibacteraceae bacterium]
MEKFFAELPWQALAGKALSICLILLGTFVFSRMVKKGFQRWLDKTTGDTTRLTFICHMITGAVYVLGIAFVIYQIDFLRGVAVSLVAGSGVMAVIIGFASQTTFSNIVSGFFISVFQPFRIGDRVRFLSGPSGIVEDITLRHTVLRTLDNKRLIIPNNNINGEIIENASIMSSKVCQYLDVGVSYRADLDEAMRFMAEEVLAHPASLDARTEAEKASGVPEVTVRVIELGDSSVKLRAWVWSEDVPAGYAMICDLLKNVKERFEREGVEIPFPQRVVHLAQMENFPCELPPYNMMCKK